MGQQQQQPQQPVPQDDRSRHITLQGFNRVPLVCFALMVITLLMLCVVNVDDGTVTLPAGLGSFHYQRVYTTKNTDKHKDAKICYPQVVLEEDDFDNFQVLGGSDTTTTTTTTTRSSWNMGTVSNSIELNTNFLGPLGQGHDQVSKEFDIPVLAASSQQHQLPIPASNVTVEFKLYQMNDWSSSSSADEDDKMLVLINNVQIDLGDMTVHQPFSGTEGNIVWERSAPLQEQSEDAKMPVVYKVRITVPSSSLPGNRFTLKFQTATSKPILEQSAGIDDLIITGFYQCQQQEQPQQSPHKKINNSTAPVESTPEQTPTAAAPATPNPEVKENTEDETPEEMEESLEENGGETCAKLPAPADGVCAAANPSTLDNGVHGGKDPYAGWYSLNNDGCCQDFCRWVGGSGSGGDPGLQIKHRDSYWSCRPAGYAACTYFEGFGDTFNFAKCDGQGMPAVSKPVIEAETAAPPPLEEIKEEETPQEMEESLEEEDGETCVELPAPVDGSCPAANPSMLDNGVHSGQDPYTGWYSLNNDGCCQDFCRWVGSSGSGGDPSMAIKHHGSYWSCRPAGYTACTYFEGFGDTFNFAKCDSQGVPSTLEPEPEEEEETPEEMEESLEDEDGETCTQLPAPAPGTCAAANPSTLDNGVHRGQDPYAGWFSLNNDGCCQDFCRWVGGSGSGGDPSLGIKHRESYWSCRPAGYSACTYFEGFGEPFNYAKCDGQGVPAAPKPVVEAETSPPPPEPPAVEVKQEETPQGVPADPSAPQQQTVWERLTSKGRKTITVLEGSGLGSQMINMLAQKIYFEAHGKEYFVDDTEYGYRWDDNTGVLQGYFTPQFPVLQRSDWQQMTSFMGVPPRNVIFNTNDVYRDGAIEIIKSIRFSQRKHFRKEFKHDHFGLMVPEACKHLQFNQRAKQEFKTLIDANNIPNLRNVSSAAFHIRRGDKILAHESIVYSGANYVDKLLEAVGEQKIDHCFISSGDYAAVEEVQAALQEKQVGCQVHTLTQQAEHGADESVSRTNRANTVQFLAEMSQLIDATFFVGTFNSNVGSMAALLRACIYPKKRYGNSYGVDTDDWYYVRHRD